MKINPTGIPNYVTGKRRVTGLEDAYNKTSGFPSGDELAISQDTMNFAKVFAAVKENYSAGAATEPARVSSIASRIADGTYSVDSELLADSILGDIYG